MTDLSETPADLSKQLLFLKEIDALKSVDRASLVIDKSRRENTAEHSWHLAMYALILEPYSPVQIDINRVIKMLLLHDIVEIDAGDIPIHSGEGRDNQAELENQAAERLYGILPRQQEHEMRGLWAEFESAQTNEAKFAKALDRLQPLIQNIHTDGGTWTENQVGEQQVYDRYGPTIRNGSERLWQHAKQLVEEHFRNSQ